MHYGRSYFLPAIVNFSGNFSNICNMHSYDIFFSLFLFCCCSCFVVVVFLINFAYCLDVFCLVFFFSFLQTASKTRSIKVNHSCVKGED